MRGISLPLAIVAALLVGLLHAAPAHAQATRTWISGVGDDVNPCSRTAPCKTFAGAISKTAVNGEINCLDPGGYGAVTITKSITLDCRWTQGSILHTGTNGITIAFDSFNGAGETRFTVRLRGLSFNGADTGVNGIRIIGGAVHPGGTVIIEETAIDGDFGGGNTGGRGISDERSKGGELFVTNTSIRDTANGGIVVGVGAAPQRIDATLQNVRVQNSNVGLLIGVNARVQVENSTFTGNTNAGIYASGSGATVNVNNSNSSNNGIGIQNDGGLATIQLSNNDITFNGTALSGATQTFTNNRVSGNGSVGTAPTAIGSTTNPTGQM